MATNGTSTYVANMAVANVQYHAGLFPILLLVETEHGNISGY